MKSLPAIDSGAGATNCRHAIRLLQTGEAYVCSSAETLLQGMARIGKKGIPAGCLNGGCGVCKVVIRCGREYPSFCGRGGLTTLSPSLREPFAEHDGKLIHG
ncbi:2Fe-2S iron-sulfur cluster-binding protein [Pusillimonas minor]|uniref:2Fe-2S iron-sulfur cluster binding domain-containing protein n=1 Tax=Pusillimonas minor TaxID=2697024 RepID=A0A842HUI0_9BURK|nr:2Fe-2S iron-sulfur cluster binding domain-containing protein [Pusillimonas minor]